MVRAHAASQHRNKAKVRMPAIISFRVYLQFACLLTVCDRRAQQTDGASKLKYTDAAQQQNNPKKRGHAIGIRNSCGTHSVLWANVYLARFPIGNL